MCKYCLLLVLTNICINSSYLDKKTNLFPIPRVFLPQNCESNSILGKCGDLLLSFLIKYYLF